MRARSALGAARQLARSQPSEVERLLTEAERDTQQLARERMPWADAVASLLRAGVASARGSVAVAELELARAADELDGVSMELYAAAARHRRGQLLGGDAGAALIESAEAWFAGQGVKAPAALVAMMTPGFDDPTRR